jgi:uncharacterized protein YkwD
MPLATPVDVPAHAAGSRAENAIVRLVNVERRRYGLRRLRVSSALTRSAEQHSWDCLRHDWISHVSSDGTGPDRRIARVTAARASGETMAWSQRGAGSGARSIVRMWMRSSAHRAVVLSPKFRRVGVGRIRGKLGATAGVMVTADFASAR